MFYVWCVCLHVYMEKKYQGNKEMKDEKLMSKLKSAEIHLQLQSSCIKEAVVPVSRATEASSLNDAIDSLALKKQMAKQFGFGPVFINGNQSICESSDGVKDVA